MRQLRASRAVAVGAIAAVYLLSLSPHWLPGDDSALYRLLGNSLAEGRGYSVFGQPHAMVPPGFPLLLAGARAIGLAAPLALNALTLAFALAAVVLAYLVVREHLSPEQSLWVGLLFALCNHMHDVSMQVLSDAPCVALVGLGLWLHVRFGRTRRGWVEVGSLALVAAGWVRLAAMPLAGGVAVGVVLEEAIGRGSRGRPRQARLRRLLNAAAIVLALAGTCAVFYVRYRAVGAGGDAPTYGHHADRVFQGGAWGFVVGAVNNLYGTGTTLSRLLTSQAMPPWAGWAVFGIPILAGMVIHLRRRRCVPVLATLTYLGAIVALRVPIARYLLPVGFLLMMYFAEALAAGLSRLGATRRLAPHLAAGVLIALAGVNLPRDLRRIGWVHHPDFPEHYREGRGDVYEMAGFLKRSLAPGERFASSTNVYVLGLLSGADAVPVSKGLLARRPVPTKELLALLDRRKVAVLVFHPTDEPWAFTALRAEARRRGRIRLVHANESYRAFAYAPGGPSTTDPRVPPRRQPQS